MKVFDRLEHLMFFFFFTQLSKVISIHRAKNKTSTTVNRSRRVAYKVAYYKHTTNQYTHIYIFIINIYIRIRI